VIESFDRYLGDEEVAEVDPVSGRPVSWGRPFVEQMSEGDFDLFRAGNDVVCVYPRWFVITKRICFADLLMRHGRVQAVGLGPSGGFKWVELADGSRYGHRSFRAPVLDVAQSITVRKVRCDKNGAEEKRTPARTVGRASTRRSVTGRRGRR